MCMVTSDRRCFEVVRSCQRGQNGVGSASVTAKKKKNKKKMQFEAGADDQKSPTTAPPVTAVPLSKYLQQSITWIVFAINFLNQLIRPLTPLTPICAGS